MLSAKDRRALMLLGVALAAFGIYYFAVPDAPGVAAPAAANPEMLRQRVARLRQIAATEPARAVAAKEAAVLLAEREKGMLQADTAPQAQATLLEVARRVGKLSQLDVRGGEFGAPKVIGEYGVVYASVVFECHVEQLVNFLADLARQPELVAVAEERVASANAKDKTISVRMVLSGIVARKLIPEKKGLGAL
jgi:hypothetical protein